jgi:glycosyltransferase involved in cell wall biosynthesis
MEKLPITGVVITLNEVANLRRCLESMAFCSELLVVDSGSTDGTVEHAVSLGARVLHNDWPGFGRQKQFAVEQAGHHWVLSLDADEWLSDELSASIRNLFADEPDALAYRCARRNLFLGRPLSFGGGYPDFKVRLFDRRQARWSDDYVHEKVVCPGEPGQLEGDLMHDTAPQLSEATAKWAAYASMQARAMHDNGQRAGWSRILFSPMARFFKQWLVQQGFRDGLAGFGLAVFSSFFCFYKYLELWRLQSGRMD